MGPPDSGGVSRVPPYLGYRWAGGGLRARGCHPLRPAFPGRCARRPPCRGPVPLPRRAGPAVWASSAFARRYWRNHSCLLFLRLLRCFTSPGVAHPALWIRAGAPPSRGAGCPIRTPPDRRPHAPPRGFSQLAASFIACRRQGIRRAPVQPGRHKGARPALRAARRHLRRLLLDEKTTVHGAPGAAHTFQGEMSLPPAHYARGTFSTWREAARIPARERAVAGLLPCPLPKIAGRPSRPAGEMVVGAHGLGPWTSSLSETRSNQLSYAPGSPGDAPSGDGTAQRGAPGLAPPSGGPAPGKEVIQPLGRRRLP